MPRHTPSTAAVPRARLTPDERRRQLVGIGLRKFVERPVQELSLDEVAAEAGVSRGLLFHYFPTKTAFYQAVVEAAGRRVVRTVTPDPGVAGDEALGQVVARFYAQIARRRDSYLALVHGQVGTLHDGSGTDHADRALTFRERIAALALSALAGQPASGTTPLAGRPASVTTAHAGQPLAATTTALTCQPLAATTILAEQPASRMTPLAGQPASVATAHAWVAYVEDRALQWSALPAVARERALDAEVGHCVRALHTLRALHP